MKHILSVDQFDKAALETLFQSAAKMKQLVETKGGSDILKHRVSANVFYEPSTRTSSSFEAAMYRLGGNTISINDVQYSSVAKGETLEDTIRSLEQYADCIILRHPEVGAAQRAADVASVPIINAGDGIGEHPTQALLDLFTIYSEKGTIDGLTITLVGDLKHGRTVHSLVRLLRHYDVTIHTVSPLNLSFPKEHAKKSTHPLTAHESLDDIIRNTDVLYVTRVQKERFAKPSDYDKIQGSYVITNNTLADMKTDAIIMHPLPRVGEIAFEVDSDPRAAYFHQMRNGLFVRMALLAQVLA
jgi:aspartate carbamoyltransferase